MAALAAVANFAVQKTISITTTRILPAKVVPQAEIPAPAPRVVQPVAVAPVEAPIIVDVISPLEQLTNAVETGFLAPAPEHLERAQGAASRLRTILAQLRSKGTTGVVDKALHSGQQSIESTVQRRADYEEYTAALMRIDARLQEAMDKAWRIMGRVVARQSLVAADRNFKELRRQAELLRDDASSAGDLDRLEALELEFGAAISAGARGLTKSQGQEWYEQISEDFRHLAQLRVQISQLDEQRSAGLTQFHADVAVLRATLLQAQKAAATPARPPVAAALPARAAASPAVVVPPVARPTQHEIGPAITTREESGDGGIARSKLAWLSVTVLALLLAVSIVTVLSILRPVQRLIAATQRIALGESGVRVRRGGGRELDRLAASFNMMAEDLEAAQSMARTYQQRLETRVAERTQQLKHQADHDALTQLPNRRQLFVQLTEALDRARHRNGRVGLFFLDLDNFKNINDGMGHGFGDRVLEAIANRLAATIGQRGFAARIGGDEFTVVSEAGEGDELALTELGESLVRAFHQPLKLDGRELLVSVSVGAAQYPDHAVEADSLLRAADAALFRAKALGRSQLHVFTSDLLEAAAARFSTEQDLRHAVERGELELHFQPQIDVETLDVDVAEALLRWRRPDGQLISPDEFLSVAEESGLIIAINDWVIRTAIATAARWRRNGLETLRVAVNVSSRQLLDPSFPNRVCTLLVEHDLPPDALEVELTETVLQTGPTTVEGLRRLQQLGVGVALDDFGTGYSSLASLDKLPLTRLKLDRSLIAGIDSSARSAAITNAIIQLCRDLRVRITAEGVERPAQLALLRSEGIQLQGYLLSRAVPERQLAEVVKLLPGKLESLLLMALPSASVLSAPRLVHQATGIPRISRAR